MNSSCSTYYSKKTLIEVCSPHLHASFGAICVQIIRLIAGNIYFENGYFHSLTGVRKIDRFRRKMYQKKREDLVYKHFKAELIYYSLIQ